MVPDPDGRAALLTSAEAARTFAAFPPDRLRRASLLWGIVLEPFWLRAIDVIGAHGGYPPHLHERYARSARGGFRVMDAVLAGEKVFKKDVNAVDSAISALSNGLLYSTATDHAFAPWSEHAASVLRSCLRATSPRTCLDEQLPQAIVWALLHLAAIRTGFPISSLYLWPTATLPEEALRVTGDEPEDWFRARGACLGYDVEAELVLAEARRLWEMFPDPPPDLQVPEVAWTSATCTECASQRTG